MLLKLCPIPLLNKENYDVVFDELLPLALILLCDMVIH